VLLSSAATVNIVGYSLHVFKNSSICLFFLAVCVCVCVFLSHCEFANKAIYYKYDGRKHGWMPVPVYRGFRRLRSSSLTPMSCAIHCLIDWHRKRGRWKCWTWNCRTWNKRTKFQGLKLLDTKMQDTKMQDMENAGHEISGHENAGHVKCKT